MPPETTRRTTRATPQAVLLPNDKSLRAMVTARKGSIEGNPRNGKTKNLEFNAHEKFSVLRAKIIALLEGPPFTKLILEDQNIYFRASKGAPQHRYEIMTEDNFTALLSQRVKRVSSKDKRAWNQDIFGNLRFEFCIYCRSRDPQPTIHRATVAVQQYQQDNNISLGPITRNHVTTAHARQPDETPFALPGDNTTRQAMALDASMAALNAESTADRDKVATIRLQINCNWTDFQVDVRSLRAAVGLPAHDIFTQGIYHDFVPVEPPETDMNDDDHREEITSQVV